MANKTIGELVALGTLSSSDLIPIWDFANTITKSMTPQVFWNYVNTLTAETSPATGDKLAMYDATGAQTDGITLENMWKVINSFTSLASTDADSTSDTIAVYDSSATGIKKMTLGDVVTAGGGGGSTLSDAYVGVVLHDETLGAPGRFDVSSISQDYDDLELFIYCKSDVAAEFDKLYVFFNNDTTITNYDYNRLLVTNSAFGGEFAAVPFAAWIPGASAETWDHFECSLRILDYTSSRLKTAFTHYLMRDDANMRSGHHFVSWENTDAINQITLQTDGYATDEFVAGSRLRIIGWVKKDVLVP